MEQKDLMDTMRDEISKKVANAYENKVFEMFEQHGYSKKEILDPENLYRFVCCRLNAPPYDYVEDWSADGILLFRIAPISTMDISKSFKVTTEYHIFHFREPGFTPLRKE